MPSMSTILVINAHPNPDSLSQLLSSSYAEALGDAGSSLALRDLTFDPILRAGYRAPQALEPDLLRAQEAILRAAHVAWFFPCWWNSVPALLKGFIDRTFLPGFAFRYEAGAALPRRLLTGRSARVVTSMDAPWLWHALVDRSALEVSFVRSTLKFSGFGPVETKVFYGARDLGAREIDAAATTMRAFAARDLARVTSRNLPTRRATLLASSHEPR